jgi:Lar family restriction alleviation protein
MTNDSELLPCPFCGCEAEIYSATQRRPCANGIIQGHWVVDCTKCNASIEFCRSPKDAQAKWNTRANTSSLTEIRKLRKALRVTLKAFEEALASSAKYAKKDL